MAIGVIIQARMGATRFPGKVLKKFSDGYSLLEIITSGLKKKLPDLNFVIATSDNTRDDEIQNFAVKRGYKVFRGSEMNVVKRFYDCSISNNFSHVVRICADNPFLNFEAVAELVEHYSKSEEQFDYYSYKVLGIPSILTHFGFWAELVSVCALEKIMMSTSDIRYLEHVTNFIYENPSSFKVFWMECEDPLYGRGTFRFTIDTIADFQTTDYIRSQVGSDVSTKQLLEFVLNNPRLLDKMSKSIEQNGK